MNPIWIILGLILAALAGPAAWKRKSGRWFFAALFLSFAGVVVPLFFFFVSAFDMPEWKGACPLGWLDCFMLGKLALAPLALFATAALYAVEVLRVGNRTAQWIVLGIFLGAILSLVCFVFGLAYYEKSLRDMWFFMLVPLYVAVWYVIRMVQLAKESELRYRIFLVWLLGSLPFWVASGMWSQNAYVSLPDQAPGGCFIVTAAGRGHRKWVGPFHVINRAGRQFSANQQLITLWQFEELWQRQSPGSHRAFRRLYNRFGPAIAAQIKSPWMADIIYITLKPVEFLAGVLTHLNIK